MSDLSHKDILTKAIQKAIDGGWDLLTRNCTNIGHKGAWDVDYDEEHLKLIYWNIGRTRVYDSTGMYITPPELVFNHEFAKALWGNDEGYIVTASDGSQSFMATDAVLALEKQGINWNYPPMPVTIFQYHLQMMVVADDPIAYLGEHLDG